MPTLKPRLLMVAVSIAALTAPFVAADHALPGDESDQTITMPDGEIYYLGESPCGERLGNQRMPAIGRETNGLPGLQTNDDYYVDDSGRWVGYEADEWTVHPCRDAFFVHGEVYRLRGEAIQLLDDLLP